MLELVSINTLERWRHCLIYTNTDIVVALLVILIISFALFSYLSVLYISGADNTRIIMFKVVAHVYTIQNATPIMT